MMINWHQGMQQTYKFYTVDPITWLDDREITTVKTCVITRDISTSSSYNASITCSEDLGEVYVRIYLVVTQNKVTEKFPLATVLVQTPGASFDGKVPTYTITAYSPLLELMDDQPPIGYTLRKADSVNIMDTAYKLCTEHARSPVVNTNTDRTLDVNMASDPNEDWLSYIRNLTSRADYDVDVDEMGRIVFRPYVSLDAMQPVIVLNDDDISILYADVSDTMDLYGMPNVVEVVYSNNGVTKSYTLVNDNPSSPISTVNRGRIVRKRILNPEFSGVPTDDDIKKYAEKVMDEACTLEHTIIFKHGFCLLATNECMMLNYTRYGLMNKKIKIIRQMITCESGCPVEATGVYTENVWRNEWTQS